MVSERCSPYLPLTSRRSASGLRGAILSAPRRLQEPSRALQERFKRLLAATTQLSCNAKPFYIDSDLQKTTPGPQKSRNSIEKTKVFEEIEFSAQVASWPRFWTLLAPLLGAFWPPRWLKPVLKFLLERPRALSIKFFWLKPLLKILFEPTMALLDIF